MIRVISADEVWGGVATPWAIAVGDTSGLIRYAGTPDDVRASVARTCSPDNLLPEVHGDVMFPGLVDAHCHPLDEAAHRALGTIDVSEVDAIEALGTHVRCAAQESGRVIVCMGLAHGLLRAVTNTLLDSWAPGGIVMVFGPSLHGGVVSTMASGVFEAYADAKRPSYRGCLTDDGHVTEGVAFGMFELAIAFLGEHELTVAIEQTLLGYLRRGVTTIHELCPTTFRQIVAALRARKLWLRTSFPITRMYLRPRELESLRIFSAESNMLMGTSLGPCDPACGLFGLKLFADGTIEERTALMRQPYRDTGWYGEEFDTLEEMLEGLLVARRAGVTEVAIHAIGDLGIEHALRVCAMWEEMGKYDRRCNRARIEHFELPIREWDGSFHPLLHAREHGITVVMQPAFSLDGEMCREALGAQRVAPNPLRAVLGHGLQLILGSDDMPSSMLYQLYMTQHAPQPDYQCLGFEDALRAATVGAACFEETLVPRGTLEPGSRADVVLASRELTKLFEVEDGFRDPGFAARLDRTITHVFKDGVRVPES